MLRVTRYLKIAILLVLYTLVVAIDRIFGRKAGLAALVVLVLVLSVTAFVGCGRTRIATYNIRELGPETDMSHLVEVVDSVDADLLALQEMKDLRTLDILRARAGHGKRRYKALTGRCGGRSELRVGFLYDEAVLSLGATREVPESCADDTRSFFAARFSRGSRGFTVVVAHLMAGGEKERFERRKEQWRALYAMKEKLVAEGLGPVVVLGDMNSTGFLDDALGERRFLEDSARDAGMDIVTRGLPCSEYFHHGETLTPSLLDHVVATPGIVVGGSPKLHGYCAELACRAQKGPPPREYERVSDHCPISLDVRVSM